MYSILVVGAGYLGSAIARDFKAKKQRVFALTRSLQKAAQFQQEEIVPVTADLTRPETLADIPPAHFIVICAAPDKSDEESYRKIYLDGTRNLLNALASRPRPHLIVLISSTSVWKERGGDWIDEETPADAEAVKGKILMAAEHMVLQSGFPAVVLRLSGIYGPGRNRLKSFRAGIWRSSPDGKGAGARGGLEADGYMNMIHVEDIAAAMLPIFKTAKEGEIYTGTDDTPVLKSEFSRWLSREIDAREPEKFDGARIQGKKCRNQKLKALGVTLKYPSFREGYEAIIKSERTPS